MCGIAGAFNYRNGWPVDKDILLDMTNVIAHRGPDAGDVVVEGPVGLGHRRLSIIDVAGGRQPMETTTGNTLIVFNGEIYNYKELQDKVRADGRRLTTNSDTEVIGHLYEMYGHQCVQYLRGMFAFAIWNRCNKSLFIARDRVGKKPLYYADQDGTVLFGSELKAILQHPRIRRNVNWEAVDDYLTLQYVPAPSTAFEGINELPPGHFLYVSEHGFQVTKYWDLNFRDKLTLSEPEVLDRLDSMLDEAVKIRLMSEVPLGAFLSGGIDSSLVVAYMAKHLPRVKTFSVGFTVDDFNELPHARRVAEQYGTEHHEFMCEPDALGILPKLVWHFDEPFADPSALPTYYLSQMTRQHVTVALNGDGGDEGFAGYHRYFGGGGVRGYLDHVPVGVRRLADSPLQVMARLLPSRVTRGLSRLNHASLASKGEAYANFLTIFPSGLKRELFSREVLQLLQHRTSENYLTSKFDTEGLSSDIDRMLLCDTKTYLPGDLLVKVDRMTMAHSLEGRSPLLDHVVLEFAAALPGEMKVQNHTLKYLLKKLGERYLPLDLLHRRKQGFGVPLDDWFRNSLRSWLEETLMDMALVKDGHLNGLTVTRLLQEHLSGQFSHGHRLWALMNLELWYRMFIATPHSEGPTA